MAEQARQLFLTFDRAALCRRAGLTDSPEGIRVRFLGEQHLIRSGDGLVLNAAGERASFNAVLSIYDVLCRPGETIPSLRGEFVPITALNRIHGTHSVHEDLNAQTAARFSGKAEALAAACRRRGGVLSGKGDVSFVLPVFDFFPVRLSFWDADDEFPASLQFFWDANALAFAHYETLWYMSGELTARLLREL